MTVQSNHVWYSTEEVISKYGFDPTDHIEPHTARDSHHIRSKLVVVSSLCGCHLIRYWLAEDLETPANLAAERRIAAQEASIRDRILAGYTKGLRKS